jgi:hypothetical protein
MEEQPISIYQANKFRYLFIFLIVAVIIYFFVGPYDSTRLLLREHSTLGMIGGSVLFILLIYLLHEQMSQVPEIVVSTEGIELKNKGSFNWNVIESYQTVLYEYNDNSNKEHLVFVLKEEGLVQQNISYLTKSRQEIVGLIQQYNTNEELVYGGHFVQ